MRKLTTTVSILSSILFLVSPISYGQSMFGFGGNNASGSQSDNDKAAKAGPVKKLSPADFKKNVNAIDKQTKQQLKDELNSQLSAKPPLTLQQPATPPGGSSSGSLMGPSSSNTGANTSPQAVPQSVPTPTQVPVSPTTQAPRTQAAPTQPPAPQGSTSVINKPTNNPNDQIYTGFQPQQKENNSNSSNQQSGGGWNINY